jgi:Arylsulfotransferase (ASST)
VLGRRSVRFVALATAVATVGVVSGCGGHAASTPATMSFHSRPDLHPPVVDVLQQSPAAGKGLIFIGPKSGAPQYGAEIVDDAGQPVWFHPGSEITDFKVQTYRGKPVLTWWEGPTTAPVIGTGLGSYVIMDSSYREIAHVQAGFGVDTGDLHEFQLTPNGTALLTAYRVVRRDLSSVGGPSNARVADSIVQEVDVATGKVLFTWHSLGHVGFGESYDPVPPKDAPASAPVWDYFHVNSIQLQPNGDLLVSARNTWAVYDIDGKTGKVLWRLGGKRSSFAMGKGTRFAWQHDARFQPDGTLTIFDDESTPPEAPRSRAIRLRLDPKTHTATLVRADSLEGVLTSSQGNVQQLPNGDVFVGWGAVPRYTEFDAHGRVVYDATFSAGDDSYRAYRFPWVGDPTTRPAIAVAEDGTVYASWNGATQVASWRVVAGPDAEDLHEVGSGARTGFETTLTATTVEPYVAVQALDARGDVLGQSAAVKRGGLAMG